MQRCTHRDSCKRPGRLHHECLVSGCGVVIHACPIHANAARNALEQHVREKHPVEFERVAQASKTAVAPPPPLFDIGDLDGVCKKCGQAKVGHFLSDLGLICPETI